MLLKGKTKTKINGVCVDFISHQTSYKGVKIRLTCNEQKVLEALISQPNHTSCKESLVNALYGDREDGKLLINILKVNICTLRKKLHEATGKSFILTIPWIGYQFVKSEDWHPVCIKPKRINKHDNNVIYDDKFKKPRESKVFSGR